MLQTLIYLCLKLEIFQSPSIPNEILCAVMESVNAEQECAQGTGCGHAICILSSRRNIHLANLFSLHNLCNKFQIELLQMLILPSWLSAAFFPIKSSSVNSRRPKSTLRSAPCTDFWLACW